MPRRVRIGVLATIMGAWLALSLASAASAAPVRLGARLTPDTQPQPAPWCDEQNDVDPPLAVGGAAKGPADDEDCFLLVEWQYKP